MDKCHLSRIDGKLKPNLILGRGDALPHKTIGMDRPRRGSGKAARDFLPSILRQRELLKLINHQRLDRASRGLSRCRLGGWRGWNRGHGGRRDRRGGRLTDRGWCCRWVCRCRLDLARRGALQCYTEIGLLISVDWIRKVAWIAPEIWGWHRTKTEYWLPGAIRVSSTVVGKHIGLHLPR